MSEPTGQSVPPPPRRKRWWHRLRMALLYLVIFLIAGGVFVYWVLFSPARIAAISRHMLEQYTGAEVAVGSAHLSWRGTLDLIDVDMRARGITGEGGEIFSAHRIQLTCDRSALWRGRLEISELQVDRPVLTLSEDPSTHELNWSKLLIGRSQRSAKPQRLPLVTVSDGQFRYGRIDGEQLHVAGTLAIAGRMQPQPGHPNRLEVDVREGSPTENPAVAGAHLTGWIDAAQREGELHLSGLAFNDRYRRLLPIVAGGVWDDLEPAGSFPSVKLSLDPDTGWNATVAFDQIALTLPLLTDRSDYRIRMTGVSGELAFTSAGVRISKELVGRIGGLEYHIIGTIDGYSADTPFRLTMTTEPFVIPDQPQVIYAMPEPVQKVFRMLTPAGQVRVTMAVGREKPGDPIDYQGTATLLSAGIRYAKFPYEWTHCRGVLRFDRTQVKVLGVTATGSDGATATATGVIAPLGDDPAVDLLVTAVNVPMDQMLYEAMPERHRPALDLFFNKPQYQRLLSEHHFITASQYNAEELAASAVRQRLRDADEKTQPDLHAQLQQQLAQIMKRLDVKEFDLGGRANVNVHVMREEGPGDKTTAEADVDLQEAGIVFSHFPYPMRITGGKLLIRSGRLEFVDWQLVGLHGGVGGLTGTVKLAHGDMQDVVPDLKVHMIGLPVDELLMDVLPRPQDRWVRMLNPSGTIDVVGRIIADDKGRPDVDLLIELSGGKLNPSGGDYALDDVAGKIHLSLHRVELDHITGKHGESRLDVSGSADWTDADHLKVVVDAAAEKLKFQDPVWQLFEPYIKGMKQNDEAAASAPATPSATVSSEDELTAQLRKYEVAGSYDASLHFADDGSDAPPQMRLKVQPHDLSMKLHERAVSLTRMSGSVETDGKQLSFDHLAGRVGEDGRMQLSGELAWAALPRPNAAGDTRSLRGDLELTAGGDRVTDSMRAMIPGSVAKLLDALKLDGKFAVKLDKLHIDTAAPQGEAELSVTGSAELVGGRCDMGIAISRIDGKIALDIRQITGRAWPELKITLDADRMVVADRPIEKLHAVMNSADEGRLLLMPSLRGSLYDGAVGGNGRLGLDDHSYQFHLALADVDLATLIAPGSAPAPRNGVNAPAEKADPPDAEKPRRMEGKLSAAFDVEGDWSQSGSMRGRGDILIRDGVMYDLPLALGLLQVTHLSLPTDRSFERADISYYLQSGVMHFERIVLQSPHMRLAGGGTMNLGNRKLDLSLTSDNPDGLKLGPVTDLIDGLRNQFITIRVGGTLDQPDTQVKQFTGFTDAWKDVFGTKQEQND